ncbi:MAG TPA: LPS assembly protein LptD [Gammaproteobacteria bacterium]|nr:LPS assembly protein LptD [Gammaproteobacteria bacterium]
MFHEKRAPVLPLLLTVFAAAAGRSAEAQQCLVEPDPVTRAASNLLLAAVQSEPEPNRAAGSRRPTADGQSAGETRTNLSAVENAFSQAETEPFDISAGRIEVGNATGAIFSNNVEVKRGDQVIHGERAILDRSAQRVEVTGRVTYTDPKLSVFGEDADFDAANRRISFGQAGFEVPSRTAHGSAESIVISADDTMSLDSVMFTTCPPEDLAWVLHASSLSLDVDRGFGTARGVKLEFKGVPILYTPYFTFPISSKRKSGFLTPSLGQRDRTGLDISTPYYLNLKPNLDMTLDPHYLGKRGLQVESQVRYLLPHSSGELDVSYLPNDQVIDRPRRYLNLQHRTEFGEGWSVVAGIEQVSDDAYFEDLGSSLSVTSQLYLDRYIDVSYAAPNFRVLSRVQNYQTIDTTIPLEDRPYEQLPEVQFQGQWYAGLLGFNSDSELVNFERPVGTTGWRLDNTEEMSLNFARRGMYVTPALALRQTDYRLADTAPGSDDSLSRTLPVASLDAGLKLERPARGGKPWLETLEPRLLYVHVPYVDQSSLPVFDTILPDFNLVQLFRKYQYVGPDRIADTDQVSLGFTARLIDEQSGEQKLSATLGQTRYLSTQKVTLPGVPPLTANASDYVAELSIGMFRSWALDLGYQWNSDTGRTARTETRFEYRPAEDRLFGFAYRYRRGILQQSDVSLVWPASEKWRVIGQYSYSFVENKPLERLLGLEYDACCWRLRVVGRSYVGHRTGETDNGIALQFELNGFTHSVVPPEELLDRGILGRSRLSGAETQ